MKFMEGVALGKNIYKVQLLQPKQSRVQKVEIEPTLVRSLLTDLSSSSKKRITSKSSDTMDASSTPKL